MKGSALLLITTGDKRSWQGLSEKVFLGQWCLTRESLNISGSNYEQVFPYHWDDRKKFLKDCQFLQKVYEKTLPSLVTSLNKVHNVDKDRRYWEIFVGLWLVYFIEILFDRWEMIRLVQKSPRPLSTKILNFDKEALLPKTINEFRQLYLTDEWNHYIYGAAIRSLGGIRYELIEPIHDGSFQCCAETRNGRDKIAQIVWKGICWFSQSLSRDSDVFIHNLMMPVLGKIRLQMLLKQFPSFNENVDVPEARYDKEFRRVFSIEADDKCAFSVFLCDLIPHQIPTVYLEGYSSLLKKVYASKWPKKPRSIVTSVSYNIDDAFKLYAAEKTDEGSKLFIGQHGGQLGTALWSSSENFERSIADKYLTWGWAADKSKDRVIGVIKKIGAVDWKVSSSSKLDQCLVISSVMPRYSYVLSSYTIAAGQVLKNLEDQYTFIGKLAPKVQEQILFRVFKPDWGWNQIQRVKTPFPEIAISDHGGLERLCKCSKLIVITYNATVPLEVLLLNQPTVMFWNPDHWEVRPSASPFFEKLHDAGVLHFDPVGAANFVNSIWENPEEWWFSSPVQEARNEFCKSFAYFDKSIIHRMKHELLAT